MNIVSISCTKNEEDIIEAFVRVNSRFIKHFVFIDESTDTTRFILQKLADEGFNISFLNPVYENYQQGELVTWAIRQLQVSSLYDFYLPLDADEFLTYTNYEEFVCALQSIPEGKIGAFKWRYFVPVTTNFEQHFTNGLQDCFKPCIKPHQIRKIIIPSLTVKAELWIGPGSHYAFLNQDHAQKIEAYELDDELAHFPVRSPFQIIFKNLRAVADFLKKKNKIVGEGYHIYDILKILYDNNFVIDLTCLQEVAKSNNGEFSADANFPYKFPDYTLRYTNITYENQMQRIAKLMVDYWIGQPERKELDRLHTVFSIPQKISENELTYLSTIKRLNEQIEYLEQVVKSAESWQKRSWVKRAFHKWRAPKKNKLDVQSQEKMVGTIT